MGVVMFGVVKESDRSYADHLVIMVHGILGSSTNWMFGAEQFVKELPDKVFVHCSEKNMSKLTLDGVDVMGERLANEVSFHFGVTAFEKAASCVIHWIFRRTGRHLFLIDYDEGKPPLLKRMLEDDGELYFMYGT